MGRTSHGSRARKRKKRVKSSRKPAKQDPTYGPEALWSSITAALLLLGIVCYVAWSFRVHGYAHIYMSVIVITLLMTVIAAIFLNLWWSQRRKRRRVPRRRQSRH